MLTLLTPTHPLRRLNVSIRQQAYVAADVCPLTYADAVDAHTPSPRRPGKFERGAIKLADIKAEACIKAVFGFKVLFRRY
jgi:hypothetical protein